MKTRTTVIKKLKTWLTALFYGQGFTTEKRATEMDNIERFNVLAGVTFSLLYESFPIPRNLDLSQDYECKDVVQKAIRRVVLSGPEQDKVDFIYATVRWLRQTGYIAFEEERKFPLGFKGVILTAKGLEVLNAVPTTLTEKPAGLFLKEAVKAGIFKSITDGVQFVLAKGVQCVPAILNTF